MTEDREKGGPLAQIIIGVVVTLIVGGSAPWWWNKLFPSDNRPTSPGISAPGVLPPPRKTESPQPKLRIVSSGQEILKGSYTFDLDAGKQGGSRADADIFWEHQDDTFRYLNAWNGARFAYKGTINFDHVSENDLLRADYGIARLNGSANAANQLTDETVVLIRTSMGNLCKLRIEKYGIAYPGDLPQWPKSAFLFRWTTYKVIE